MEFYSSTPVPESMDSTIIVAIAAPCGSLVGAAATIVTTWITQRIDGPRREGSKAPRP